MSSLKPIGMMLFVLLLFCCIPSSASNLSVVQTVAQPGTVALTFDDGPSPIYTPQILDILKKNNIKATFFVVGPLAKQFPQLLDRMVAEGHAVGLHAMTHPKLTRLNASELNHEVVGSRDLVQRLIGKSPVCLRPPYGVMNKRVEDYASAHQLLIIPNGFNSLDQQKKLCAAKIAQRIIDNAHSGQVILLHDGYSNRKNTVEALPIIIEGIRKKGLDFSAICIPQ
ncbi:MAG: polysaccharide deacetylase family protein [Gammaproteobacteria bacterium]|nr:polysaccharide deacetylase family protein [Gammaproteobacteria bacterium]